MSGPGPIRQRMIQLLGAYGYNLYNDKNRSRADDLLVREQAASALSDAANALRGLRTEYRRRFVPPPTRDNPEPPRERLDQLAEITRAQDRLADLETRIRGMPVPPHDRVWERYRKEEALLTELLTYDYNLISPCREAREQAQALTADTWDADAATALNKLADLIERAIRGRASFLQP